MSSRPDHIVPLADGIEDLVRPFAIATSDLVVERNLLHRTDSKFVLRVEGLPALLEQLHADYALVRAGARPVASYRTLYFDTPDLKCFHDHRRGRRPRHKVRIRHYPDRRVSYFEIKKRNTEVFTQKLRIAVPFGSDVLTDHARALLEAHGAISGPLEPQLWTNFERLTLLATRAQERVTIDFELTVGQTDALVPLEGLAIVEVKQASFTMQTPVMSALRAAGLRPTPASKYTTAIAMTRAGVRLNRLLPALRVIRRMKS